MVSKCTQLSSVNLRGCEITNTAVKAVASGCPQLSALIMFGCIKITPKAVKAVDSGCPHLTTLDLGLCRKITDAAVVAVA